MKTFTSVDADRLLGLADQFIEDWEETARESGDVPELKRALKRKEEFAAIRPLLMAAPEMAGMIRGLVFQFEHNGDECPEDRALLDQAERLLNRINQ